jgi:uncharacterized cupredoxin-like copper-binding protein
MIQKRALRSLAVMAAASLAIVGCTTDGASPSPTGGAGAATVAVTLQEWAVVLPAADSAPAGDITFDVTNQGPADVHEFVVIKTELEAADLPTDADGVVDEAGGGMDVIDEIEDVPVGETMSLTVALEAGSYVLVCNIWDEGEGEAHYRLGMRSAFTVTG